ncbi:MAG: TauD/TfdA family dioxygenase [Gammaproteobacteria bacterium]|nr:TauD/TfdA family dioxygenase [Gammaproteobacteria bacterium]
MYDLSASVCLRLDEQPTAVPASTLGSRLRCWRSEQVDPARCIIEFDGQARAELAAMGEAIRNAPLPITLRSADHFDIPKLRQILTEAKRALVRGIGVVVLDRLPMDTMDHATALAVFWSLGSLIGANVAQKWDGTMLYDVADQGLQYGYGVRGSHTSVELVFHTDNAFGITPPWYVGLLCIHPAAEGGVSRFCSLVAVHDRMLETQPRLLARLYRPMLWDRQAEHAGDAPVVAAAPMFRWHDARLTVRANPSLVHKGYTVAEQTIDEELHDALALFQALTEDPEFWFELPIAQGQMQFLNNIDIAHYRSAFRDRDDAEFKRHLVRTWHRDAGRPCYDG